MGTYVTAVYDSLWYIAQVEGEEEDEEEEGFTLLRYMNRMGPNQFFWDTKPDIFKTNNVDILCSVDPPIPVSSRYYGVSKIALKKIETLFRLEIFWFNTNFNCWGTKVPVILHLCLKLNQKIFRQKN